MKNKTIIKLKIPFYILLSFIILLASLTGCKTDDRKEKSEVITLIQLNPLSKEEAANLYPVGYDINEAKAKKLISESIFEDDYLRIQAAYLAAFNYYLNTVVSIERYQEDIDNSNYNYPSLDDSIYSKVGSFGRNNINLRNNIFVERLSKEELDTIALLINEENQLSLTKELLSIIENTWEEVIFVRLEANDDSVYEINYDMEGINTTVAYNNALTFEVSYGIEYDDSGNIPNDSYEKNKFDFVMSVKDRMESDISTKLECNVTVFVKNN